MKGALEGEEDETRASKMMTSLEPATKSMEDACVAEVDLACWPYARGMRRNHAYGS